MGTDRHDDESKPQAVANLGRLTRKDYRRPNLVKDAKLGELAATKTSVN